MRETTIEDVESEVKKLIWRTRLEKLGHFSMGITVGLIIGIILLA